MKKMNSYTLFINLSIVIVVIGLLLRFKITRFLPIGYYPRFLTYIIGHILLSSTLIISYIVASKPEKQIDFWKIPVGILVGLYGLFIINKNLSKYRIFIAMALILYLSSLYLPYLYKKWRSKIALKCTLKGANLGQEWKVDEAIKEYKKALKYDSKYAPAYCGLGWWYNYKGETEKALDYLQKSIEYNPNNSMAYVYLGDVYVKQDHLEKAITEYKKATEVDPQKAAAYFNLAIAYARYGDKNSAKINLKKSLELDSKLESEIKEYTELCNL